MLARSGDMMKLRGFGGADIPALQTSLRGLEPTVRRPIVQIPILIEQVAGNGYRSRGGEPFDLSAEGATREEVLAKLRDQLESRLREGSEVVSLDVPTE